jgi:hypothetical protein
MKPKLIDPKKIYNIIQIHKNVNHSILNKKKNFYSNIFIFCFIIFIIFIIYLKIKFYFQNKNNKQ